MSKDKITDGRKNNGGQRENAGRHTQVPYKRKNITLNVPVPLHFKFREMANQWIYDRTGYRKTVLNKASKQKLLFIEIPLELESEFRSHAKRWIEYKTKNQITQ